MPEKSDVSNCFSEHDSYLERKVAKFLKILMYVGMVSCFCMVFLAVRHSIGRTAFNNPAPGNVEIACFFLVILVFMVLAHTQMLRQHVEMGIIVDKLNPRFREIIASIMNVLILIFLFLAIWATFKQAVNQMEIGSISVTLHAPLWPFYVLICFCWAVLSIPIIIQLRHSIMKAIGRIEK